MIPKTPRLAVLAIFILASHALADETDSFVIGAIDGLQGVEVARDHEARQGYTGEALKSGDQLKVGENVSVTVWTPDGGSIALGRKSKTSVISSEHSRNFMNLTSGTVRGSFPKAQENPLQRPGFRFILRTPTAVLGILGTEFIASVDETGAAEFTAMDGTLYISRTVEDLMEGKGTKVNTRQAVTCSPEKIGKPHFFYPPSVLKKLKSTNPGLENKPKAHGNGN